MPRRWGQPFLRGCAVLFAFTNFGGNALYLLPVVAAQGQGLSSTLIGTLIAIYGGLSELRFEELLAGGFFGLSDDGVKGRLGFAVAVE